VGIFKFGIRHPQAQSSADNPLLKGQLHEIFDPWFFHQSTPLRALIHGLKPFCIWPNPDTTRDIPFFKKLWAQMIILNFSGVNDPAKTVSAGSMTLPKRLEYCRLLFIDIILCYSVNNKKNYASFIIFQHIILYGPFL
jgi:hypothetical protein